MKNWNIRSKTGKRAIRSLLFLLISAGLILSLPSCNLFRKMPRIRFVSAETDTTGGRDSSLVLLKNNVAIDTSAAKKELIHATATMPVWSRRTDFRTFSTKARMHYDDGSKSYDFVANIRMRKDSIIWVSVTVGGLIQVARAVITPDSFKAVVFVEKEAYLGPVSKANEFLPAGIDFYALQNLLIGDPVLSGGTVTDATDFGGTWSYRFEQANYIQQTNYNKADSTLRSCQVVATGTADKALQVQYGDYRRNNNQMYSDMRKLNIINGAKQIQVDMNYNNSAVNEVLSFPFSIPQNYQLK
jgi:hypothetical protein